MNDGPLISGDRDGIISLDGWLMGTGDPFQAHHLGERKWCWIILTLRTI